MSRDYISDPERDSASSLRSIAESLERIAEALDRFVPTEEQKFADRYKQSVEYVRSHPPVDAVSRTFVK